MEVLMSTENKQELATFEGQQFNVVDDITSGKAYYFSGELETKDEKKAFYNAVQNPDEQLRDHINETIELVNIYAAPVELDSQEEPGVKVTAPRIILFDADGTTFTCCSVGIYNSMKQIIQTFGYPQDWDEPIKVQVKQISRGANQILTLKVL